MEGGNEGNGGEGAAVLSCFFTVTGSVGLRRNISAASPSSSRETRTSLVPPLRRSASSWCQCGRQLISDERSNLQQQLLQCPETGLQGALEDDRRRRRRSREVFKKLKVSKFQRNLTFNHQLHLQGAGVSLLTGFNCSRVPSILVDGLTD